MARVSFDEGNAGQAPKPVNRVTFGKVQAKPTQPPQPRYQDPRNNPANWRKSPNNTPSQAQVNAAAMMQQQRAAEAQMQQQAQLRAQQQARSYNGWDALNRDVFQPIAGMIANYPQHNSLPIFGNYTQQGATSPFQAAYGQPQNISPNPMPNRLPANAFTYNPSVMQQGALYRPTPQAAPYVDPRNDPRKGRGYTGYKDVRDNPDYWRTGHSGLSGWKDVRDNPAFWRSADITYLETPEGDAPPPMAAAADYGGWSDWGGGGGGGGGGDYTPTPYKPEWYEALTTWRW